MEKKSNMRLQFPVVSGYTKKVTGSVADGYVAAFTHSVYKTSVVVQNTWSDLDNALPTRPSSLTVQIYANGKATSKKVVLNSANKWKATVSGLNKNSAGKKIAYSAKLVKTPTGYKVTIGSTVQGHNCHQEYIHQVYQETYS